MQVQLSGKKFSFPRKCACCGAVAETDLPVSASRTTGKRVVKTRTNTWQFPYCRSCVAHVNAWDAASAAPWILISLIGGVALGLFLDRLAGVALVVGGTVMAAVISGRMQSKAKRMCSPNCVCPGRAVSYLGWSGTVEVFDLVSENRALEFMLANQSKLINLSIEQRALLQGAEGASPNSHGNVSSSTFVSPDRTVPRRTGEEPSIDSADHVLVEWVAKLESLKGPEARRATVELALKDGKLAARRDEFIKSAAKIEVRATLDKVESLKTVAAKKRHLADALTALRADSAADELQQSEIQLLEAEIARLTL